MEAPRRREVERERAAAAGVGPSGTQASASPLRLAGHAERRNASAVVMGPFAASSRPWRGASSLEFRPDPGAVLGSSCEDVHRGPSRWRQPHEEDAVEDEVFGADVLPRVKEWDYLVRLGIDACEVRSLVAVALPTRQGEVVWVVRSAVLAALMCSTWNVAKGSVRLGQTAIFAAVARATAYQITRGGVHQRGHRWRARAVPSVAGFR